MKNAGVMVVLAVVALGLQGCATTGGASADHSEVPSGTVSSTPAVAASSAAVPSSSVVPEEDGKPVVRADTKENFEAIVAAIHQQMQPGGRWQYVDKGERATLDNSFADMATLYDQFGGVDKMNQAAKVRLLADQSTVNAILTRKDGDRLICRSEIPVGSHLPIKTCKTYAQLQAEQRGAQEFLRNRAAQNSQQLKSGH